MAPTLHYASSQGPPNYFMQNSNMKKKPNNTKKKKKMWENGLNLGKMEINAVSRKKLQGGKKTLILGKWKDNMKQN